MVGLAAAEAEVIGLGLRADLGPTLPTRSWAQNQLLAGRTARPVLKHGPRSLTSVRVLEWQTLARNKRTAVGALHITARRTMARQWYSYPRRAEHSRWDPKDGELCLDRMKPEETLVEVRSRSDVQIDGQI